MLKALKFLGDGGEPTDRYYQFLDQTQGRKVLGEAIEEAYSDLFQVNKEAQKLSVAEAKNKLKTLTQGQHSENVIGWMANTFVALASLADFEGGTKPKPVAKNQPPTPKEKDAAPPEGGKQRIAVQGLQYVINLQLPESRDPAVYDALFRSLREHLDGG